MKLAIVVGHSARAPGAFSETLKSSEYAWNRDLAFRISALPSPIERRVFFRDRVGITGAYAAADAWGANLTVELHFNAAVASTASGTGTLHHPRSARGRSWAALLQAEMTAALGLPPWPAGTDGVVTPFRASGREMRGQTSLSAGQAPAALIEPFFGSNPGDAARAAEAKGALAHAILRAAERWPG